MKINSVASIRDTLDFSLHDSYCSYVNGEPLSAGPVGTSRPLIYPATGEQWATLEVAGESDIEAAISSARHAFSDGSWSRMPVERRQAVLRKAGQLVLDHAEELAVLECLCTGLPVQHLRTRQMPRAAENFFFFADYIGSIATETFTEQAGCSTAVSRKAAGVVLVLSPWNASLAMASMQIASCIAFGNSCISKPSEYSPAAVLRLAELLGAAGLPDGVVNVVCGGPETGMTLVKDPGINRIAFTGKSANGKHVMAAAAANLTPVKLGLSAKSANIVFADTDLERAVNGSVVNAFSNSGQICVAGSRILVQEQIAEQFIHAFKTRVCALVVGDPMDPSTQVGPLGFAAHRDSVLEYMRMARGEGAKILVGGEQISGSLNSCFVQPTVVLVQNNKMRICQEEVFGPFVTIQVFKTEAEAIQLCNDSRFGLLAYVWTQSQERIANLQESVEAGTLWINTPLLRDLRAPFGGVKESGIGRDGPRECADFYTEAKTIIMQSQ